MGRIEIQTAYALTIGSSVKIQDVLEIIKPLFANCSLLQHLFQPPDMIADVLVQNLRIGLLGN